VLPNLKLIASALSLGGRRVAVGAVVAVAVGLGNGWISWLMRKRSDLLATVMV